MASFSRNTPARERRRNTQLKYTLWKKTPKAEAPRESCVALWLFSNQKASFDWTVPRLLYLEAS
jgi:hypothetical protein